MSALPLETAVCAGKEHFYIPGGPEPAGDIPDCVFLAGFDQLMLGYRKEGNPFLPPEHLRGIFNLAGIVMPPLLLRGRVVGRWKRSGRRVTVTAFEEVGAEDRWAVSDAAARLWGDIRTVEWK